MKSKKVKKREGNLKSLLKDTKEVKSGYVMSSVSKQSQVMKQTHSANRLHHALTNLGIPILQDSKYVMKKFVSPEVDTAIKDQIKNFSGQRDKGQFGNCFLKYSSPNIIDDKHAISKRKGHHKIDLSTGISSEVPDQHQKWPYGYRPIICKHSPPNELQKCLNRIFPPKEWTANGEDWHQSASPIPAARKEVIDLKYTLENLLQTRNAKVFGLCSIRLGLYLQCFDELIRQVTICCLERGMIMAQVRDTIKSTLWSYHTVYESCCALGIRKTLNHEEELLALSTSITNIVEERNKIREKIADMEKKIESVKDVFVHHSNNEESKHSQRMILLRKANEQIKNALLATAEGGPKKKKIKGIPTVRSGRKLVTQHKSNL